MAFSSRPATVTPVSNTWWNDTDTAVDLLPDSSLGLYLPLNITVLPHTTNFLHTKRLLRACLQLGYLDFAYPALDSILTSPIEPSQSRTIVRVLSLDRGAANFFLLTRITIYILELDA